MTILQTIPQINWVSEQVWLSTWSMKSWLTQRLFLDKDLYTESRNEDNFINAKPFVKWAWWKRQILSKLEEHLPEKFRNYFEPFLWWWSFYFYLKSKNKIAWKSYLSDYNVELINTYKVIKENPDKLIDHLEEFKNSNNKDFYYELRALDRLEEFNKICEIQRAARFIYLNKTCYNWIWRVNSKWQNNVPYWKNSNPAIFAKENILSCNRILNYKTFLDPWDYKNILKKAKKWDFIFLDPPYDPIKLTSNFTSYNGFTFSKDMQIELFNTFRKLDKKWCFVMMTNSSTPFIQDLFEEYITKYQKNIISVKRFINCQWQNRLSVEEIIIKNYSNEDNHLIR